MLGINAQIRSQSGGGEGVGFAIPVDAVRRSLRELRDEGRGGLRLSGRDEPLRSGRSSPTASACRTRTGALVQEVETAARPTTPGLKGGDDRSTSRADDIPKGGDVVVAVDGGPLTRATTWPT